MDGANDALLVEPAYVVVLDEDVPGVASDFRSSNKINSRKVVFMDDGGKRLLETDAIEELLPVNTLLSSTAECFILSLLGAEGDTWLSRSKGGESSVVIANKVEDTRERLSVG